MFGINDFLEAAAQETRVLKHLHSKAEPAMLDFRPAEGIRSTIELMRYLSFCGAGPTEALVKDDWSDIGQRMEKAGSMAAEEFPARLDEQLAAMKSLVTDVSESDLTSREVSLPWGATTTLGPGLVNIPLAFLVSYRLQLFNHLKVAGATPMDTFNAWMGADRPAE